MKKNLFITLLLSICLTSISFKSKAQMPVTAVTVDASGTWLGYMNVYDLANNFQFGSGWGLADVKSTINTASNSVTLQPNFNTYNATDPYWSNGAIGNKIMEANTFQESTTLTGQTVNFSGGVVSYTLDAAYTATAFVKALDPANGYATVVNETKPIPQGGNFCVSASIPATAGLLVQYGFTITGLNANPLDEATLGSVEIEGLTTTTVVVDGSGNWNGYMNVYDLSNNFQFGSGWGLADLKSTINATSNSVTLQPNFNTYNATDPYWSNGANGNKLMEANTFLESTTLTGQNVMFTGNVSANTLDAAYSATAFVKALDPALGYATVAIQTTPLPAMGTFCVTATIPATAGLIVQYGFTVEGINANPINEATLGSVQIGPLIPTPLNLISFNATLVGNNVDLNWHTEDEKFVKEFEVQNSADGISFETFTRVAANNEAKNLYSTTDYKNIGRNYYRLKMVDIDGSYTYSPIVKVNRATIEANQLFPNPATDKVTIATNSNASVTITNSLGSVISTISTTEKNSSIDISNYATGLYFVKFANDQTIKLIKE